MNPLDSQTASAIRPYASDDWSALKPLSGYLVVGIIFFLLLTAASCCFGSNMTTDPEVSAVEWRDSLMPFDRKALALAEAVLFLPHRWTMSMERAGAWFDAARDSLFCLDGDM